MAGIPHLVLPVLLIAASSTAAQAPSAPVASGIIAASPDPLGDLAARRRVEDERCRQGVGDDILVCGRPARAGGGYRVPYRPEPGARVRLIAGEPPSAMAAMGAGGCLRLCQQPVTVNLLDPGSIVRGLDRILSRN
ncbi:MAG TPA: hypothetical protein VEC11_00650 [Allosphingosinicella sp.]|nr:hypothetical protein [Allosphingosinicella sp.]